jgi:hypothetical protein
MPGKAVYGVHGWPSGMMAGQVPVRVVPSSELQKPAAQKTLWSLHPAPEPTYETGWQVVDTGPQAMPTGQRLVPPDGVEPDDWLEVPPLAAVGGVAGVPAGGAAGAAVASVGAGGAPAGAGVLGTAGATPAAGAAGAVDGAGSSIAIALTPMRSMTAGLRAGLRAAGAAGVGLPVTGVDALRVLAFDRVFPAMTVLLAKATRSRRQPAWGVASTATDAESPRVDSRSTEVDLESIQGDARPVAVDSASTSSDGASTGVDAASSEVDTGRVGLEPPAIRRRVGPSP